MNQDLVNHIIKQLDVLKSEIGWYEGSEIWVEELGAYISMKLIDKWILSLYDPNPSSVYLVKIMTLANLTWKELRRTHVGR